MWPLYLVLGFLNVYAQHHNYGINITDTNMDIRVRRDVQETEGLADILHVFALFIQTNKTDREKRETQNPSKANVTTNNDWRNNYVWSKIKNHKNQRNNTSHKNPVPGNINGTRRYTSQHTIMPRYNMTGFKSGTLYPASHYNSTAYNTHILQNVKTNTGNNTGSIYTNAVLPGNGITTPAREITPVTPGKSGVHGSKKMIRACLLCTIPCPVGRHRDESGLYCFPDDAEY